MGRLLLVSLALAVTAGSPLASAPVTSGERLRLLSDRLVIAQAGRSCKAARTCREAVEMWCGGYRRADADGDGIPCETVCRSLNQVEAIKHEIGC